MIKKMAVVAVAAAGLVVANASWAVANSGGYGGDHGRSGNSGVACVVGRDAGFSNICGNTYVYNPNILDNLLNLLSPPTTGGGGGNNGGGNNGGGSGGNN
ncbi:hypothetical protein [Streptomyces sp. NBC_00893]|uniref:hypothetical protein n=1 Tax=Streptomyces sp. NBC_00893 TaxID=2975862 RepID=UPI0022577A9E|nr:hypothetical protein [Streptomyces sp. NBC_00893]MCX4850706.1 hypothetical protein [Streptomyces sp. NBC_00893]